MSVVPHLTLYVNSSNSSSVINIHLFIHSLSHKYIYSTNIYEHPWLSGYVPDTENTMAQKQARHGFYCQGVYWLMEKTDTDQAIRNINMHRWQVARRWTIQWHRMGYSVCFLLSFLTPAHTLFIKIRLVSSLLCKYSHSFWTHNSDLLIIWKAKIYPMFF